jgi:hypothetical protein
MRLSRVYRAVQLTGKRQVIVLKVPSKCVLTEIYIDLGAITAEPNRDFTNDLLSRYLRCRNELARFDHFQGRRYIYMDICMRVRLLVRIVKTDAGRLQAARFPHRLRPFERCGN